MSTRERLHSIIDEMSVDQMEAWLVILEASRRKQAAVEVDSVMGILHQYANPDLIPLEKDAWAEAASEKEKKFWEERSYEDT